MSQFVDDEIDNAIEKVKIKKNLGTLQSQLIKKDMTLKEVVD